MITQILLQRNKIQEIILHWFLYLEKQHIVCSLGLQILLLWWLTTTVALSLAIYSPNQAQETMSHTCLSTMISFSDISNTQCRYHGDGIGGIEISGIIFTINTTYISIMCLCLAVRCGYYYLCYML